MTQIFKNYKLSIQKQKETEVMGKKEEKQQKMSKEEITNVFRNY